MNFTPWETINEAINAGAKFWSVYDQSGKRLIFELNQDTAPEDSADKLKSILHREQGEFVQVKLSFQNSKDKGNGGNVRGFTYYYKLPNPGGTIGAPVLYSGSQTGGVGMQDYLSAIEAKYKAESNLQYELLKMQYLLNSKPTIAEQICSPENLNRFFTFADNLVGALTYKMQAQQTKRPVLQAPKISENTEGIAGIEGMEGISMDDIDMELAEAVSKILSFRDGRQAIINIAAGGDFVWSQIHIALTEKGLLS
jgi:hypothetical protein